MQWRMRSALTAVAIGLVGTTAWAEVITLDEAISRAISESPELRAGESAVRSAEGSRVQAAVRPNPSVTIEGENVAGTGAIGALRQSEFTVTYAQPIERGNKREARIGVAEADIGLAEARLRVVRLDYAATVQSAYIDVLIAREVVRIADFRLTTEQEILSEALRRVRGYKDPLFVETRSRARVTQARLKLEEAHARLQRAKGLLGSYIGVQANDIDVTGPILRQDLTCTRLADADIALDRAGVGKAQATLAFETTRRTQDYTVSGGLRYLRGTNDVAVVGGITIPLGRNDRNQGNIASSQADMQTAEFMADANQRERRRRLTALCADADAAKVRADGIINEVFPQAIKTLDQVRWGYNRGGFNFRDVQDAADAILEVQDQWVEAMTRYRDLISEIDRLTGRFDSAAGEEQAQ